MRYTEELLWVAKQEGVEIVRYPIRPQFNGLYLRFRHLEPSYVLIDQEIPEDSIEYRAIFGEEMGHHHTSAGSWAIAANAAPYSRRLHRASVEVKALRWAIDFFAPPTDLLYLLRRRYSVWEIAEEMRVPETWILEQMYQIQRGQAQAMGERGEGCA